MLTRLRHSRAVGVLRYHLYRDVLLAYPRRRSCNICSWRGRRFLTYFDPFVLCPQCGSHVRQRRVLRSGGLAILTVPQNEERHDTYEDPSITSDAERLRHFGQTDHVRIYGLDFGDRVAAAGFDVTSVDAGSFEPHFVAEHVLRPQTENTSPIGTTNRRVYFARRR